MVTPYLAQIALSMANSGIPAAAAAAFRHLPVLLPDEIADLGLCSLPCIERADTLVDFRTQCPQLSDMREHCPPDLFLILGRQALHFGNSLFKRFDHGTSIPDRSMRNRGGGDAGYSG
jgi:hypothetical protein